VIPTATVTVGEAMSDASGARRVAVVLPDMIGTTVCAVPALHALRAAFPTAAIDCFGFEAASLSAVRVAA
jgi:hypothetical protein